MKLGTIGGALLAALTIGAFGAANAGAATTIGQFGDPTNSPTCANGDGVYWQESVSSGNSYTVPAGGGVVTSFITQTGMGEGQAASFKVLARQTQTTFTVAGSTPVVPLQPSTREVIPTRLPVSGGEVLGLWIPVGSQLACWASRLEETNQGSWVGENGEDPAPKPEPAIGGTVRKSGQANYRLQLQATVEPDADRDGYGDETQDGCPTNARTQGACPPPDISGVGPSEILTVDKVKPTLGALALGSTVFKAARSGASIAAKPKVGTKVSYRLSEAATVRFTVERKTTGRKVGKKCKTRTKSNAKNKRCTRWTKVRGAFSHTGKPGKNTFTFRGRVGGRSLAPGSYRLGGQATDKAKNTSLLQRRDFRIVD